jgi:hypothetical protein
MPGHQLAGAAARESDCMATPWREYLCLGGGSLDARQRLIRGDSSAWRSTRGVPEPRGRFASAVKLSLRHRPPALLRARSGQVFRAERNRDPDFRSRMYEVLLGNPPTER